MKGNKYDTAVSVAHQEGADLLMSEGMHDEFTAHFGGVQVGDVVTWWSSWIPYGQILMTKRQW